MLKGFVSGEEKDIKRIPMKGKNLFDGIIGTDNAILNERGNPTPNDAYALSKYIPVEPNMAYVYHFYHNIAENRSTYSISEYDSNKNVIQPLTLQWITENRDYAISFTTQTNTAFIRINWKKAPDENLMLNLGSQALPYEPYGYQEGWEVRDNQDRLIWGREDELQTATGTLPFKGYALPVKVKTLLGNAVQNGTPSPQNIVTPEMCGKLVGTDWIIPLTNAGQTIPVYLGEVPTVRRVRKLVFDGTEIFWEKSVLRAGCFAARDLGIGVTEKTIYCTHAIGVITASELASNNTCYIGRDINLWLDLFDAQTTVEQFKTYLASEYQAGHPVTVWYVLAEPETTISNEPLCKISTYADELTTIQVHGLSAPLYGIGDYKDMLNLSTGVVTRKVKKLVLTGQEQWQFFSDVLGAWQFYINDISLGGVAQSSCMSNITPYGATATTRQRYDYGCYLVTAGKGVAFQMKGAKDAFTNITSWTSFLASEYAAGRPVIVWYVLDTPETETVTVPTGMTGEIEGYLTQVSTPTPTKRSVPKWNGVEETGGTYAVTVYTPPEIPTTTGQNTLTVETDLAPSKLEVSIHAKKIHYGFKIDKSNDDSESAVIYTHDAVTMTPAHMDFTNDRFDYGSWGNAFFVRDCYPVALNLDGTIAYRLDPDDYTKKTDGTASDIFYELLSAAPSDWGTQWKQYYTKSGDEYILNNQGSAPTFATDTYYKLTYNSSFTGNFMMAFPKVWFYRHEDSQYNYIEISNYKLSDDWKCYAHINASGQEVDFIYLPLFKGVIVNSKLRSLPGQIPQCNTTATDEVNAATALGSRWQIWDHSSVELINDLLTLMSKSIDSQGKFGKGRESGYNSSDTVTYGKLQTGTLIKGGKFHGFSSSYKEVKVFGIEGFWANRWDRLQGMLLVNNVWKIKMTPPYNFTGTDFVTLSNAEVPTGNGYLSKVQTSEYGSIPASIDGGSSTKYFKDYFYKTATDTRVAIRGGYCNIGGYAGFRSVYVRSAASGSNWRIGASPVYK